MTADHSAAGVGGWNAPGVKVVALYYNAEGKRDCATVSSVETSDAKTDRAILQIGEKKAKDWHSVAPLFPNPQVPVYNEKSVREVRFYGANPAAGRFIMLGSNGAQMEIFLGSTRLRQSEAPFLPGNSGGIVVSKDSKQMEGLFIRGTDDGKGWRGLAAFGHGDVF